MMSATAARRGDEREVTVRKREKERESVGESDFPSPVTRSSDSLVPDS